MSSPFDEIREFYERQGQQRFRQWEIIVRVVFSLQSPFTAESVINAVADVGEGSRISRATAYRALQVLTDSGFLTVSSGFESTPYYSHSRKSPAFAAFSPKLCLSSHPALIAGTCPWCGQAIFNGKLENE